MKLLYWLRKDGTRVYPPATGLNFAGTDFVAVYEAADNQPDVLQVMAEQCDACLFTKDRVTTGERAAEIIRGCRENGTHFICHKGTLAGGKNTCCRAFYDTQKDESRVIRLATSLGVVRFVEVKDDPQ